MRLINQHRCCHTYLSTVLNTGSKPAVCVVQVWVTVDLAPSGTVTIGADSDSDISRGLAAVLVYALSGLTPIEIENVDADSFTALNLGPLLGSTSRVNSFRNMLESIKKRTRISVGQVPRFPSLLVTADALTPQGAFAEAQALFLEPRPNDVNRLAELLKSNNIGVVAHFYMDPQVQGVLSSAAAHWPHVAISGVFLASLHQPVVNSETLLYQWAPSS